MPSCCVQEHSVPFTMRMETILEFGIVLVLKKYSAPPAEPCTHTVPIM
jgi:hypothetical protein